MSITALKHFLAENDVLCPECGYNLRGIATETCPECRATLRLQLERIPKPNPRRVWFVAAVGPLGALSGLLVAIQTGWFLWNQLQIPSPNLYPRGIAVAYVASGVLSLWLLVFGALGTARIVAKRNRPEAVGEVENLTSRLLIYILLVWALGVFWTVARFTGLFG